MALSNVIFNRGEGGLGRPLAGEDHISGLVFYVANGDLPAGFSTSDRIKQVFSVEQAEALGIVKGGATTKILYYHIAQYFAQQPSGQLFVGLFNSASIDYTVIEDMQVFADGKIRQIGVYDGATALATGNINSLNASAVALNTDDMPLVVLYAPDISAISDLSTLTDLSALNAPNVSVVIGQDGSGEGKALYDDVGQSITTLGASLGILSKASVHQNMGYIALFDLVKGSEFEVPAFANGTLTKTLPTAQLSAIAAKHYNFIKKYVGSNGTYFNDAKTCIAATSDYATLENMRTIQKIEREVRKFLLPNVNGELYVNPNGTLTEDVIALYKNDANRALQPILVAGEISAKNVIINPAQNVLSTSQITLTIEIVPVGVARKIVVNIGFTVNVSN